LWLNQRLMNTKGRFSLNAGSFSHLLWDRRPIPRRWVCTCCADSDGSPDDSHRRQRDGAEIDGAATASPRAKDGKEKMDRRTFLTMVGGLAGSTWVALFSGCRGHRYGHVLQHDQPDLVGSHTAGAEVFNPLIEEAVAKLLARQQVVVHEVTYSGAEVLPTPKTVCFVGVENKSIEELGDFKDQIYQQIDTMLVQSESFQPVSKRVVDAALRETRMRPDSLLIPDNMRMFAGVLEQHGQPLHYLLYATITSGSTVRNASEQRDYLLTLEMVNVHTGAYDKQSAEISKGYHRTRAGKFWHYNPFKQAG
jgi:hypothetical protein